MVFSPSQCYLAYSNTKSQIFIYKLNVVQSSTQLVRQIDNSGTDQINTLRWDEDSAKLYYGSNSGSVDVILVPQQTKDYFHLISERVLKMAGQPIVQLDVRKDLVLVSSSEKVILFHLVTKTITFIGTKPRSGQFGACFWVAGSGCLKILAARPSYRIWIASLEGTVEETQQYKMWTNSPICKIRDPEMITEGSSQFHFLHPIRGSIVLAGDHSGPMLLVDVVTGLCLVTVDCGPDINRIVCSTTGCIAVFQHKWVSFIKLSDCRQALLDMLGEPASATAAIDLFMTLQELSPLEGETDRGTANAAVELQPITVVEEPVAATVRTLPPKLGAAERRLANSLPPEVLTRLVELSAELQYRFMETNQLQVLVRDSEDYQRLYVSGKTEDSGRQADSESQTRLSNGSMGTAVSSDVISSAEQSIESTDFGQVRSSTRSNKSSSRKKNKSNRSNPILRTLYDKTATFLTHMDVISSGNSDIQLSITQESFGAGFLENIRVASGDQDSMGVAEHDDITGKEIKPPQINTMELEANVYITWEKLKQLHLAAPEDVKTAREEYSQSLAVFCESWLSLTVDLWLRLREYELHIRTLSGTFPVLPPLGVGGVSTECNSWSNCVHPHDWLTLLPLPQKIAGLVAELLARCCMQSGDDCFCGSEARRDAVRTIADLSCVLEQGQPLWEDDEVQDDGAGNKGVQVSVGCATRSQGHTDSGGQSGFPRELIAQLEKCGVWRRSEQDHEHAESWVSTVLLNFSDSINMRVVREWTVSGIHHCVWLEILDCLRDIYAGTIRKTVSNNLILKPQVEVEQILLNYMFLDTAESLVVIDELFSVLKQQKRLVAQEDESDEMRLSETDQESAEFAAWHKIVESDCLECRTVLHLCLRHNLDLTEYMMALFAYSSGSIRFVTRNQLVEHIYKEPEVLVAFVLSVLTKLRGSDLRRARCSCGALLWYVYSTSTQPEAHILIEILRWGAQTQYGYSNPAMFQFLTELCLQYGFHEGYMEMLVGTGDFEAILRLGVNLNSYDILQRIKDVKQTGSVFLETVIRCLVESRRSFKRGCCWQCGHGYSDNQGASQPLPWRSIGRFFFTDLLSMCQDDERRRAALVMVVLEIVAEGEELTEMAEFLHLQISRQYEQTINVAAAVIGGSHGNRLYEFIKAETLATASAPQRLSSTDHRLTEMYLDLYSCSRAQLCGRQWGRILSHTSLCDLCGLALLDDDRDDSGPAVAMGGSQEYEHTSALVNSNKLTGFSCGHCCHTLCLAAFDYPSFCVLCCQ